MITINLLDWRDKRKKIKNNRFFAVIGLTVLACALLVIIIDSFIQTLINAKQKDITYLTGEIGLVEQKIQKIKDLQTQKDLLLKRRAVIESLQDSTPYVVKIFDNLARIVPSSVVLDDLSRKENLLVINGTGDSNATVSEFMKNIQKLRWVESAKLTEIKLSEDKTAAAKTAKSKQSRVSFRIEATLILPQELANEEEAKKAASTPAKGKAAATKAKTTTKPATPKPGVKN